MKIGNIYVTRQETLLHDPEYRKIIAKIARAEVKNYLAELAEAAEMPFEGPVEFMKARHVEVRVDGVPVPRLNIGDDGLIPMDKPYKDDRP